MSKDEALDKALNALLWANIEINDWRDDAQGYKPEDQPQIMDAITAINQALAAPVQEPVAWMSREDYDDYLEESKVTSATVYNYQLDIPLYTAPPAAQRQWVGLTDEVIHELWVNSKTGANATLSIARKFARAIEAKLKEKNT